MSSSDESELDPEGRGVVFRDKRRLDPETGQVREEAVGAPTPAAPPAEAEPAVDEGSQQVAELTETLQRLQAEYANYRKRVERDRQLEAVRTTAAVLVQLLPLLDDVDRARQHGDLTGGFKGVGESLESLVAKLGLERFGEAGEPFDPNVHEAVMQAEPDPAQSVPTCAQVFQPGFQVGGLVLRPARVSVAEGGAPSEGATPTPEEQ